MFKFNPVTIVAVILVIGGIAYFLHNYHINIKVDVKDTLGNKSHMSFKHDAAKEKYEDAA